MTTSKTKLHFLNVASSSDCIVRKVITSRVKFKKVLIVLYFDTTYTLPGGITNYIAKIWKMFEIKLTFFDTNRREKEGNLPAQKSPLS